MVIRALFCYLFFLTFTVAHNDGLKETSTDHQHLSRDTKVKGASPRIVGGVKISDSDAPWLSRLLNEDQTWFWCSGSLVTPEFVLTTAYCADPAPAWVQVGAYCGIATYNNRCWNADIEDMKQYRSSQIVPVETNGVYIHDGYDSETGDKDFALIRLNRRVTGLNPVNMDGGNVNVSTSYPAGR